MTNIIDISLPISPTMLAWPGDPAITIERTSSMEAGDTSNISRVALGSHTGTHVDPPLHFINGAPGADELPLDVLYGEAIVVDARGRSGPLGPGDLASLGIPYGAARVLIRSDNSALWRHASPAFPGSYTCLSADGATWLIERRVRLVGVDFLSIEERDAPGHPVHRTLLGAGVVIVEGLDLWNAEPGPYTLAVLPLKIANGDGAPARAVLLQA